MLTAENFLALGRLSGNFLDRLRGLDTLRLFNRAAAETENIRRASEEFPQPHHGSIAYGIFVICGT
jgi:ABC-type transport system involved in cytochrome bd biosynthesis fused ATPase/permease subunit